VLADSGPSSSVSQSRCKSVYGTESHASVNTPKRREHNLIYVVVNLTGGSHMTASLGGRYDPWPVKRSISEYDEEKRGEHNLIYVAVNLTREYN